MRSNRFRLRHAVALGLPLLALVACVPTPPPPLSVTVARLSVSDTAGPAGSTLQASATLRSNVAATLPEVVVAVRDSQGRVVDFPLAVNRTVSTIATTLASSRSFAEPGNYTYWVAYNRNGAWTDLAPRQSFSVTRPPVTPPPSSPPPPAAPMPPALAGPWKLSFADEFNGTSLTPGRWGTCYPRPSEQACSNIANGEAQWYKPGNVSVGGGMARLEARREATTSPFTGATYGFTSGLIQSKSSFNFTYGYLEARMLLPKGSGFWPAFWTWPTAENWPPEIDVMEAYGDNPGLIYQTLHGTCGAQQKTAGLDWTAGWHTFAADWEPGSVRYFVDGKLSMTTACSPSAQMYLIANLAVANGTAAPAPNSATVLPSALGVDYIRVWQH